MALENDLNENIDGLSNPMGWAVQFDSFDLKRSQTGSTPFGLSPENNPLWRHVKEYLHLLEGYTNFLFSIEKVATRWAGKPFE